MSRPRKYTNAQVSAVLAMAAIKPRPCLHAIAKATGTTYGIVRHYLSERSKVNPPPESWVADVETACSAVARGLNDLAAYHFCAAAKHFAQKSKNSYCIS